MPSFFFQAFKKAWSKVCSSPSSATLMVPAKKSYLLKPTTFSGPCKSQVLVMVSYTPKDTLHHSPKNSFMKLCFTDFFAYILAICIDQGNDKGAPT